MQTWDGPGQKLRPVSAADSLAFLALRAADAHEYILQRARTEQIIIINEAHHNPRHRVFTASLLPELARLGFRYFAAEGLDRNDSLLNQRGYPTLKTGYYTKEPQFAHLLRTALQTGFQLVPYDYGFVHESDPAAGILARETAQARNIQRILQADPKAKIVVHCGFSHVNEGPNGMYTQMAMAGHLRKLTGLNPFTIDQTALTESGTPGGEYAYYRLAKAPTSSVFIDVQQQPFAAAGSQMSPDVNVFHPRTTYRSGRPEWVFSAGRQPVVVAKPAKVGFPCLILAYTAAENSADAIPVDIIELQKPEDRKALALAKGRYLLIAKDPAGNTQTWALSN
ncbi:hypothetical protein [Hymenobacter sediminicola]|uniref:Erythromycin esterase family protein n=1 Tax=Hymenobacter sediminicola TaxID=2761579 RepID=A0A7G7W6F4_9BACT|nr:hypothetical protein [Hymenobacter sediminicola]QNH61947.1 hypothetical protein H4317_17655 [Hymenobacter sediminicola]